MMSDTAGVFASASTPAAHSPISFRSIPLVGRHAGDQGRLTPANPAIGLVRGVNEMLERPAPTPTDVLGLAHGTTVATNALLQGEISSLGLIVTEGFRHILEIARQSVPEGYGNSYFWVKPERIVPLQFVREVGGRLNFRGDECARSTRPACATRRASSASMAFAPSASA